MTALGPAVRPLIALATAGAVSLGASACGPRVESGNEDFVLVKAGALTSFEESRRFAEDYCAQYGKRADVEGSNPDPATLQDTYRFDCVQDAQ